MSSQTTCTVTGLHLIKASGGVGVRVARTSLGPLHVWPRSVTPAGWVDVDELYRPITIPWEEDPAWSRWDTVGRTLYVADSPRAAEAVGMSVQDYLAAIEREWKGVCAMEPGQFPAGWRHDRALYEIQTPGSGWWIDVEHGDSLTALSAAPLALTPVRLAEPLTRSHVLDDRRRVTVSLAMHMRSLKLFDGSSPLGVVWESKTGYGRNWAHWMRRVDDGLDPGADDPSPIGDGRQIAADDRDLRHVAAAYGLHVH